MTRIAHTLIAALTALIVAQAAIAAGEPKNQQPFTRAISTHQVGARGEVKSQMPFARPVVGRRTPTGSSQANRAQRSTTQSCEPKNQVPFTKKPTRIHRAKVYRDWFERYAHSHPYGRATGSRSR